MTYATAPNAPRPIWVRFWYRLGIVNVTLLQSVEYHSVWSGSGFGSTMSGFAIKRKEGLVDLNRKCYIRHVFWIKKKQGEKNKKKVKKYNNFFFCIEVV